MFKLKGGKNTFQGLLLLSVKNETFFQIVKLLVGRVCGSERDGDPESIWENNRQTRTLLELTFFVLYFFAYY
jgi:hypothetical protein